MRIFSFVYAYNFVFVNNSLVKIALLSKMGMVFHFISWLLFKNNWKSFSYCHRVTETMSGLSCVCSPSSLLHITWAVVFHVSSPPPPPQVRKYGIWYDMRVWRTMSERSGVGDKTRLRKSKHNSNNSPRPCTHSCSIFLNIKWGSVHAIRF